MHTLALDAQVHDITLETDTLAAETEEPEPGPRYHPPGRHVAPGG